MRGCLSVMLPMGPTIVSLSAVSIVVGEQFANGLALGLLIGVIYSIWMDGKAAPEAP